MNSRGMEAKINELSQWCRITIFVITINAKVLTNLAIYSLQVFILTDAHHEK